MAQRILGAEKSQKKGIDNQLIKYACLCEGSIDVAI